MHRIAAQALKQLMAAAGLLALLAMPACKNQYLEGTFTKEAFLDTVRWRNPVKSHYNPETAYLDSIRALEDSFSVKIFLGTWCSDSRRWVGRFFAIQNRLPVRDVELIGLDTAKMDPAGKWVKYNIDSVPTFLFFQEGQLIGRFNTHPSRVSIFKRKLSPDIYRILKNAHARRGEAPQVTGEG